MYGRSLSDFPERIQAFRFALAKLSEADINGGFELAIENLKEFPTPADIRELAMQAARRRHGLKPDGGLGRPFQLEERIKTERFDGATVEQLRREFNEMFDKVSAEKGM